MVYYGLLVLQWLITLGKSWVVPFFSLFYPASFGKICEVHPAPFGEVDGDLKASGLGSGERLGEELVLRTSGVVVVVVFLVGFMFLFTCLFANFCFFCLK